MSSWSGNGDDGGGAAPFRASPVRDSTDPAFWGIERHSASRILKDLAGASKPRPKPLDRAKKQPAWSPAPKPKGGVLDVSLTTSSMARNEAKEQINARFGLQYDPAEFASTSLRPVVPSGAITPAAQRILAPRSGRSHSSLSVHSAGGMLGMISVRRSKDNLPDRSWQAVFTEKQNFSQKQLASQSLDDVRQDRKSGLYIRAKSRAGTDLDVSHSNSRHGHSVNADHSLGGDHDATVLAGADEINTAIFEADIAALDRELQFPELVENLTNLSVIRQFVTKSIGESGVLSVLRIMNKSCTSLEEAARREANAPKAMPAADETESGNLYYWLERLRQHRRFVLEESEALHRRPQAVLEKALLMQTTLPLVYKSASSLVRAAERKTQELMATLDTIKSSAKQSVGAATMLAGLKAEIRAMCLDGSMQTSHTQPVAAATFRVLIAEVGQRTIQVRKVMIEGGIAVDEATLLELLRRDEGLFPSAFDFGLARQAVLEAKSALEDLKNAIVRDREIETELRKKIKAAEEKLRREETELKKIEENEKQLEFEKKVEASKLNRVFAQAIQKVAWEGPCGGGNGSKLGGAVVLEGSHVYATADDNNIMVYDLDTTLFDFCKKYCLAGGHTQTVTCLAVIDGHTLFSGSMDHTICVWDVERDFAAEQILQGHTETVSCMAISDSNPGAAELEPRLLKGRFLCSGSYDMTIRIWEALLNEEHAEGKMTASIESGKGNPSVSRSGSPLQRKELRWQCARVLFGHGCFIHSIVTQGKFVYSAGEDGLIKKWDVTKRHSVGQLEGIEESVYALCLRREGAGVVRSTEMLHLLTSGIEYGITAWDLQDKSLLQDGICGIAEARVFKLTPDTAVDSARAEIVDMEHKIEMAVTEDGRMLLQQGLQQCRERLDGWLEWKNTLQYVNSLAYSKGFIYSGGGEDCVRVWSTDLSTCVGNVGGLQGVYAMSVDGDLLSVCTRDNRVHLLGTPERAEAYSKAVEERENKFRTDGGELWLFDLVNDSARMLLPGIRVRSVSCGQKHGLALDDHGRAYSWGVSARGQCGLGTKDDVKVPRRIENIEGAASISDSKVKEVSAGWFHSILLMTTGVCFACGENDLGQLGLPESKESEILYAEWQEAMQVQARAEGSEHKRLSDKIASISTAHSMANLVYTPRQVILGASQVLPVGDRVHSRIERKKRTSAEKTGIGREGKTKGKAKGRGVCVGRKVGLAGVLVAQKPAALTAPR